MAFSHESTLIPERYYVDTTGMWMLEAFFDAELARFENRHREYLAYLVNAVSNPAAHFIGVVPTESRRNNILPPVYELVSDHGLLHSETVIGADGLFEAADVLEEQFATFCRHLSCYGADILKFATFHSSGRVSGGFFNATGRKERIPGVPDFVDDFVTSAKRIHLCNSAGSADVIALLRAFAIFQRGFKYAARAATSQAVYLTHPIRWSASGKAIAEAQAVDTSAILGAIAATAIQRGRIKSSSDLFRCLLETRNNRPKWHEAVERILERTRDATSDVQRDELRKELTAALVMQAAPWVDGELDNDTRKAMTILTSGLWGVLGVLVTGSTLVAPVVGGVVGLALTVWGTPMKIGTFSAKVLRKSVDYKIESFVPQSCGLCGAPGHLSSAGQGCSVCGRTS